MDSLPGARISTTVTVSSVTIPVTTTISATISVAIAATIAVSVAISTSVKASTLSRGFVAGEATTASVSVSPAATVSVIRVSALNRGVVGMGGS